MITLIVAHDEKRVIGKDNKLPWHLPEDMKLFKERTDNHVVIMGRKTWDSLPEKYKPLPNRINIVVTRDKLGFQQRYLKEQGWVPDAQDLKKHPLVADSIEEAIRFAAEQDEGVKIGFKDAFIIGGEQIYNYCLDNHLAQKLIISEVEGEHEGDAYFPELGEENWKCPKKDDHEGFKIATYWRQ